MSEDTVNDFKLFPAKNLNFTLFQEDLEISNEIERAIFPKH